MMEQIELFTRDGAFVGLFQIPRFRPKAEVLVWGDRTFVYHPADDAYIEGLSYHFPLAGWVMPEEVTEINKRTEAERGR